MEHASEILVIGAGSAGRYAARTAAFLGKNVTLVESGPFGGLCILKGCMPSKALLRPAHALYLMNHGLQDLGLRLEGKVVPDIPLMIRQKNEMVQEMASDALHSIEKTERITLVKGHFSFSGPNAGHIDGAPVSFEKAIIATGSSIKIPSTPGLRKDWILTSDDILDLESLPQSLLVIGGGPVGLELGQYLSNLGSTVSLVDTNINWHPEVDHDLSREYLKAIESQGISIFLGVRHGRCETRGKTPVYCFQIGDEQHEIPFDKILVATGRRPNTEKLNLSAANVNTSRHGHVRVDHFLRTSNPQIYAAGDVTGILPVLNLATYHGEQAGRNVALSTPIPVKERFVPIAIFTEPEYSRVGLSETEARNRKIPVHTGRISFVDLGKAIVNRQTEGGLKIVAHAKSREILGVEIFGPGASDLIHTLTVAMHFHATIDQYQEILHIHPTFSEIFKYLIDEMTESL
ncbi:MAG: dihydrolipoyl dehydrogenase family protein [Leptospirales bacterium]